MVRSYHSFPITDFTTTRHKMLSWANRFNISCFLDNNQYQFPLHSQECLLGAGMQFSVSSPCRDNFKALDVFIDTHADWIFGHLGYDLKNELYGLTGKLPGYIDFPDMFFFVPEILVKLGPQQMTVGCFSGEYQKIFDEINNADLIVPLNSPRPAIRQRLNEKAYTAILGTLRQHIIRGDCYEINYCMEFFSEGAKIDPPAVYTSLLSVSPNPFSAYYRVFDQYLLCASPERYLRKEGGKLYSQPIKGTSPRDLMNAGGDLLRKEQLFHSQKDRSENVMVVDLVRNDLSRICKEGTVEVEELFGIYSFPQVHQMISTISGEIAPDVKIVDIFKATFPMGSMTGAPKIRVMELIEKYEISRRGLFSGALGYISPERDMDFNVVIRSILYNAVTSYLSLPVGSGITYYSEAPKEYQECLLKAEAMLRALIPAE